MLNRTNDIASSTKADSPSSFVQSDGGGKRRDGITRALGIGPIVMDSTKVEFAASVSGDGKLHCAPTGSPEHVNVTACDMLICEVTSTVKGAEI